MIEELETMIKLFEENYKIVFSNGENPKKDYKIGKKNGVCRFCEKDSSEITFNNISHAIPECLGNKTIICLDECDECNKRFSENIEDHLDKITLPYRTMNLLKGKKNIPKYKTPDKKARMEAVNKEKNEFKIEIHKDSDFFIWEQENEVIKLKYTLPPHIPAAAYKALVKMALSVMPDNELKNFNISKSWIQELDHTKDLMTPLNVYMTFIPGINPLKETLVFLFKKFTISQKYPDCMFVLCFGNIIYQISIPTDIEIIMNQKNKTIPIFRLPFFEINFPLGKPKHSILDWTQNTKKYSKEEVINFGYDGMHKIIENGEIINSEILEKYKSFKEELNKFPDINL
ncbi:HNH endonuclease [Aliarcobacter butzleri]|uniref:HNH endonuclease n=1 Tax=Aliarcobacter butzleri TaxID=28197 RepID=UPI00126049FD|nr:hypothetical protein [Aliarcobacter butzleri]